MNESIKICSACHTENQPNYNFCKNCGLPLAGSANVPPSQYGRYVPPQGAPVLQEIDGVPIDHVSAYVGAKPKILERFMELEITGGKSSWCWPVFILGFFFGFIGMSCWFFYRKIYKTAIALLIAGLLIFGLTSILQYIYGVDIMKNMVHTFLQSINQLSGGEITFAQYMSNIYKSIYTGNYLILATISSIIGLLQKVAAVLVAMYALTLYKKSATQRIKSYAVAAGREVYPLELQTIGGTSPGLVVLVLVGYFAISSIVSVAMLAPFLKTMEEALSSIK